MLEQGEFVLPWKIRLTINLTISQDHPKRCHLDHGSIGLTGTVRRRAILGATAGVIYICPITPRGGSLGIRHPFPIAASSDNVTLARHSYQKEKGGKISST